jgi:hypothetical protein
MAAAASCIVPFAVPLDADSAGPSSGPSAWQALLGDPRALPNLKALLARHLVADEPDVASETSLSTPAERAVARALGWGGVEGGLPLAAHAARADGLELGELAWGLLTPVHWHVGTEQVGLTDPEALRLDALESRAFFDAVRELFVGEGMLLAWGAPLRWYLAHESLAELRTASLDRVIGRNVDVWLGAAREQPALRRIHRLQAEMQMLLHEHPLNLARVQRGQAPVNSFWLSGCGVAQPARDPEPVLETALRRDALAGDWAAWVKAWEQLDAGGLAVLRGRADAGAAVALVLCGERGARRFASPGRRPGWWSRVQRRIAPPSAATLLAGL